MPDEDGQLDLGARIARLDRIYRMVESCTLFVSPYRAGDTVVPMPGSIERHAGHAKLMAIHEQLADVASRMSDAEAPSASPESTKSAKRRFNDRLKLIRSHLTEIDADLKACAAAFAQAESVKARNPKGCLDKWPYILQRAAHQHNIDAMTRALAESRSIFDNVNVKLDKIVSALGKLPNGEQRNKLLADAQQRVTRANVMWVPWLHCNLADPTRLEKQYRHIQEMVQQRGRVEDERGGGTFFTEYEFLRRVEALAYRQIVPFENHELHGFAQRLGAQGIEPFRGDDLKAFLFDLAANVQAVKRQCPQAYGRLWADADTMKAALRRASVEDAAESSWQPLLRIGPAVLLDSFRALILTEDLHTEVRRTSALSGSLDASRDDVSIQVGRLGVAWGEEALALLNADAANDDLESQLHLVLHELGAQLKIMCSAMQINIHSVAQIENKIGFAKDLPKPEVESTIRDIAATSKRMARAFEEMSEWLLREIEDSTPLALSDASADLRLRHILSELAFRRELCDTIVWAGVSTLELAGYPDRAATAPPAIAEDEQEARAQAAVEPQSSTSAIDSEQGEPPARSPALARTSHVDSAVRNEIGHLPIASPGAVQSHVDELPVEKLPIEMRPTFQQMKAEINEAIGADLDEAHACLKRATSLFDRHEDAGLAFISDAMLLQTAAQLESAAASQSHARQWLREKSGQYLEGDDLLFPQFDVDLDAGARECEKVAAWMRNFAEDPRSKPLTTANFRELRKANLLQFRRPTDRVEEGAVFKSARRATTELVVTEKPIKLWNGRTVSGRTYWFHGHLTRDAYTMPLAQIAPWMIIRAHVKHLNDRRVSSRLVKIKTADGPKEVRQSVPYAVLDPDEGYEILMIVWNPAQSRARSYRLPVR